MNQDFRQQRISDLAAALVAALPTGKRTKLQAAAALDAEDDYERIETVPRKRAELDRSLVNNVLIAQLMQRQREVEAKQL
jgi:hypothetical protein